MAATDSAALIGAERKRIRSRWRVRVDLQMSLDRQEVLTLDLPSHIPLDHPPPSQFTSTGDRAESLSDTPA